MDEKRRQALGVFIRTQRQITRLSLRQLANLARVSNPYLSQIERGQYEPSGQVLKRIAKALGISVQALFERAGLLEETDVDAFSDVETAIRLDDRLTGEQKDTLLRVYRGFLVSDAEQPTA